MPTNQEEYLNSTLTFTDKAIKLGRRHLMNQWEEPFIKKYMLDLLRKYQPASVLEVGFGYGYTASIINAYPTVKRHVIIEPHPEILVLASQWAVGKNVEIIPKFIEDFKTLEKFDLIWDDIADVLETRVFGEWKNPGVEIKNNYEIFLVSKLVKYMTEADKVRIEGLINEEING